MAQLNYKPPRLPSCPELGRRYDEISTPSSPPLLPFRPFSALVSTARRQLIRFSGTSYNSVSCHLRKSTHLHHPHRFIVSPERSRSSVPPQNRESHLLYLYMSQQCRVAPQFYHPCRRRSAVQHRPTRHLPVCYVPPPFRATEQRPRHLRVSTMRRRQSLLTERPVNSNDFFNHILYKIFVPVIQVLAHMYLF